MAVFRIEKTRDYTVMSNHHLKDRTLTLKSKGLLSMMLSLPDEWNYTTRGDVVQNHFTITFSGSHPIRFNPCPCGGRGI